MMNEITCEMLPRVLKGLAPVPKLTILFAMLVFLPVWIEINICGFWCVSLGCGGGGEGEMCPLDQIVEETKYTNNPRH